MPIAYGVAEGDADAAGEADGDGDRSGFSLVLFNFEDGVVFTEVVLVFFPVLVLVVPARVGVVVVCASSFFWLWQPRNAVSVSTVIKDKTDVFIVVKLIKSENVDGRRSEQALNGSTTAIFSFILQSQSFILWLMSTRILVAGIVGGIVMFIWSFIAHDVLPIGEMGVREIPNEEAVTNAIESNLGDRVGFYIFPGPGLAPGATREQKAEGMKKVEEKMAAGAAGVLIYHPKRVFNFPKRLAIEFVTEVVQALLLVFMLAQTRIAGFAGKVGFILTAGILVTITANIPYWNWYGFPRAYTVGYMITQIVGFLLVGIVAAFLIKPKAAAVV